ncbi:LysR substrate-binding domain-containing protein [Streptomyces sp. NPDC014724]|uniref:LysR substrate-binding domain-containing protein n=1 Tax=unclassified Streptomyces TaxID=2593676 RepID=UPI0036FA4B95
MDTTTVHPELAALGSVLGRPAACRQAGFTSSTRCITADIAARLALARAGLATGLVPRTAIDPATPKIRTASIEDRPILRLLFATTRRTETTNPATTAAVAALRTAARQNRTPRLRRSRTRRRAVAGSGARTV